MRIGLSKVCSQGEEISRPQLKERGCHEGKGDRVVREGEEAGEPLALETRQWAEDKELPGRGMGRFSDRTRGSGHSVLGTDRFLDHTFLPLPHFTFTLISHIWL